MKIVCPTCNAVYKIRDDTIPSGKRAMATCKRCGGKIVIKPRAETRSDETTQAEYLSGPPPSSFQQPSSPPQAQAGAFQFISEQDAFKGYAGFWKRFAAFIIDGLILMVGGFIIWGFINLVHEFATGTSSSAGALGNLGGIILGWLYFAIMESSSTQGTLGKMALGIKVTDLSGNAISFGTATGRHFGKIISAFIFLIGYLMVAFTSRKRGLHDMMAGCLVVNRK
jgi:predicted Zn finger-like uncharacterized protein